MESPDSRPKLRHGYSLASTRRLERVGERHGERGAILVLAMVFLTVVLTLTLAVLSLAQTGSTSLKFFRLERTRRYGADAAMQSAVQNVKNNPAMGVSTGSPPSCDGAYNILQDTASGDAFSVIAAGGATLKVVCTATPGTTSGGLDSDGGQAARDVTFEVQCNTNSAVAGFARLACTPSGSTVRVLARARVRYDVDYGIVPTSPDCNVGCTASTVRAVVPKAVFWSLTV